MAIENRNGKWYYRFWTLGRAWSKDTGLAATERNRNAAILQEAEARKLVGQGKGDELGLTPTAFSSAADQYVEWARGEYRVHPNSWKRIRGSMTSLKAFFQHAPIHSVNVGRVQDYMAWRRSEHEVREVTLRHDLHALSGLFQYAEDHTWAFSNPVTSKKIKIPSDQDAVRFHRLAPGEEAAYFAICRQLGLDHLHDIAKVMLLQGPRPSEVMALNVSDLHGDTLVIRKGKSNAAKRTLHLTPEATMILEARAATAGDGGWLFPGKRKGAHLVDIENAHQEVLKEARLAFVLYDFRHNFATRFAEVTNGDVVALAAILGHANLRTVMRYVHPSDEHKRAAMAKYATHLEAQKARAGREKQGLVQ